MRPDLIFDIGMHDGSDSAFYLAKGYRVVAIEANPHLCAAAERRFKLEIDTGRLVVINEGVADRSDVMSFGINKTKSDWSSFVESFAQRGQDVEYVGIQVRPLDYYLSVFGTPYYCKIDIEGHDEMCIQSLERAKQLPKYVSTEATVGNFCKRMSAIGYAQFKIISQVWHQYQHLPFPPREGEYVDARTTCFMTGPFGDETYGPWLTAEEFEAEYANCANRVYAGSLHAKLGCPMNVFMDSWFDFHAKLI